MGKREVKTRAARVKRWRWWTESEAQQHLKAWGASGKPLSTFAYERGLSETRLRWWKKRMGEWSSPPVRLASPEPSTFIEARLVPAVASDSAERPASPASVTVRVPGGIVLEVDTALVSAEWVAAVVTGLRRAAP